MRISDRVARRDNLDFSCLRRMDAYIVRSLLFGPFCAVFTAAVTLHLCEHHAVSCRMAAGSEFGGYLVGL